MKNSDQRLQIISIGVLYLQLFRDVVRCADTRNSPHRAE